MRVRGNFALFGYRVAVIGFAHKYAIKLAGRINIQQGGIVHIQIQSVMLPFCAVIGITILYNVNNRHFRVGIRIYGVKQDIEIIRTHQIIQNIGFRK